MLLEEQPMIIFGMTMVNALVNGITQSHYHGEYIL